MRCAFFVAVVVGQVLLPSVAESQTYPTKPVRIVTGYTPGGATDLVARLVADKLSPALGQPVIVENRPGASGNIAAQAVSRAAPDGHTVLFGATAEIAINRHMIKNMGFDPDTDLTPVGFGFLVPLGLLVPAASPYASVKDLVAAARATPGKLTFANSGNGTPAHLAVLMLTQSAGIEVLQVPYKGGGPAMTDLIAARVDAYFLSLPGAMPHVKGGKVKLLAVSSAKRSSIAPETPTVAESGNPGFDFPLWGGFFVPSGTPSEIVSVLSREIGQALKHPDVAGRMGRDGMEVPSGGPEDFRRFVQSESQKYADLIRRAGFKPE